MITVLIVMPAVMSDKYNLACMTPSRDVYAALLLSCHTFITPTLKHRLCMPSGSNTANTTNGITHVSWIQNIIVLNAVFALRLSYRVSGGTTG